MHIEYKHIRHGYARIDKEGNLLVTIPLYKKNDQYFIDELTKKGQQLLQRYNKRTHIDPIQQDSILLFGEQVPMEEIKKQYPKYFSNAKFQISNSKVLKSILEEYSTPLVQKYSEKIGIAYKKLSFRKTKSKR